MVRYFGRAGKLKQFIIVAVTVNLIFTNAALAFPNKTTRAVVEDSTFYLPDEEGCAAGSGGGATPLQGKDNQEKIWNYFIGKGLKPFQVAGILGNVETESAHTFDPRIVQGGAKSDTPTSAGYGVFQFTPGTKIVEPAKKAGKAPSDLGFQLDYVWNALNTEPIEKEALAALKASSDVAGAATAWEAKYERPASTSDVGTRIKQAQAFLAQFGSGGSGRDSGGDATGGPNGAPTDTAAGAGTSDGCGGGAGGQGISPDGWVFPQQTTKSAVKKGSSGPDGSALVRCFNKQENCHHDYNAADIFAETGVPELAVSDGKVIFAHDKAHGSLAILSNNPKSQKQYVFWYGHMKQGAFKVKTGDTVKAGQQVGEVGTDADADNTASHLHIDAQEAPPATTRENCKDAACAQPPFKFINEQPFLVAAYNALPE